MQSNSGTIFLAGATGAIGRRLTPLLLADGWQIIGTTRSEAKAADLERQGVQPVVVDVFDEEALRMAMTTANPDVVIHQLTDLPYALEPSRMEAARQRNARLREVGTRNLAAAAQAVGARRMIAQSVAFAYAPGPLPYTETAPLNLNDPSGGPTARAIAELERQVLGGSFEGVVLRYGKLYGPGTGFDRAPGGGPLHVDAAADAARRAVTNGKPGIYNIAEDDGTVSSDKAKNELGWSADYRI